jgi:dienelactone hydrolase
MKNFRESGWTFMGASNVNARQPRVVGKGAINLYGLYDVAGNVREWCVNPGRGDQGRLAMGGGWEDAEYLTNNLLFRPEFDRTPSNGVRLFSLADDDTTLARLSGPQLRVERRDFRGFKAVGDAEFAVYRRMYDYDHRPLDAKVEAEGVREHYRWQKVSFSAGYGFERMIAYVLLPKNATAPFEPVILWPPGYAISHKVSEPQGLLFDELFGFIAQNGRAVVVPLFKESYERDSTHARAIPSTPDTTAQFRDHVVMWIKDLRRTVDYMETRKDLKADRIGFFGISWGGQIAPIALSMEPRIKAAVLNTGGYSVVATPFPEVDAANYSPRVKVPVLMLSGQHDNSIFPYEVSQRPFFEALGTPIADKNRVEYAAASHIIPLELVARETIAWFDHYLRR